MLVVNGRGTRDEEVSGMVEHVVNGGRASVRGRTKSRWGGVYRADGKNWLINVNCAKTDYIRQEHLEEGAFDRGWVTVTRPARDK